MFTGIVETIGSLKAVDSVGELTRLSICAGPIIEGVGIGDSIAVNGVCLTVTVIEGECVCFEAVRETMECTSLGDLTVGSEVNLERALRAGDRLDGHIVQGHVDGVGFVRELAREGDDVRLAIDCDSEIASYLVDKGSVTIDGVSLTVVSAGSKGFDVALIPHTLEVTTLKDRKPKDRVNLEVDVLGKYVKRYLDRVQPLNESSSK
jgi:riboflavin synthase